MWYRMQFFNLMSAAAVWEEEGAQRWAEGEKRRRRRVTAARRAHRGEGTTGELRPRPSIYNDISTQT